MSRYTGPKARRCRREGVNLFSSEKYQKILTDRPGTPGVHGVSMRKKPTQYGKQLREKQKVRYMFGTTEKQMTNYYKKASTRPGDTGEQLMTLLELRFDNAIFRAGFTKTRNQARQFITHGHVLLNGSKADIPSIKLRAGDEIEINPKKKKNPSFKDAHNDKYRPPTWLKVDRKNLSFTVENMPDKEDFDGMIEMHLIVEFYSR